MTPGAEFPHARSTCTVTERWVDTTVIVSCAGDLDMVTSPALERRIDDALAKNPSAMVIDLSDVVFLASHGMGVLIGTHDIVRGQVDFAVVADGPATSRPMTLLGLETQFPLHATLDAALDALRERLRG